MMNTKRYYKEIDEQIVFFQEPLIHDGMQTFNPTEEMILADGWLEYVEPEPTPADPLQQAIENKLMEIDEYDKSTDVNSFIINGKQIWLDSSIRQQLRTSIEAYKATGKETASKWFDGQLYTYSINTWIEMLNLLEVYASEALNTTESHKVAVKELTSVQEVENYDITLDYPEKLEFE